MQPTYLKKHDRLEAFMEDLGVDEAALGRMTDRTPRCIRHYLNGTHKIPPTAAKVIAALSSMGVNPDWLRYKSDKKYNETRSPGLRISEQGICNIKATHIEELVTRNHNLEIDNNILRIAHKRNCRIISELEAEIDKYALLEYGIRE